MFGSEKARNTAKSEVKKFADAIGLIYYPYIGETSGFISKEKLPWDDPRDQVRGLKENFQLLLDYLELEIKDGKRIETKSKIVKKKPIKKSKPGKK